MNRVKILNLTIDNISQRDLLAKMRSGGIVFTPNVDHLVRVQKDRQFYQAYMGANYRVCDSKILQYASFFLGTPITEKISGSDLFPAFYQYYKADEEIKIFLVGSLPQIAESAKQKINAKVGRNIVVGSYSPSFDFVNNEAESQKIIDLVDSSDATVLALGVSAPKQEIWLHKYRNRFKKIRLMMGIGATIDFEAGRCQRAPKWMRDVGLEWFHRLMSDPKRLWKRYLVEDIPFFWLLVKQKLRLYHSPFPEEPMGESLVSSSEFYLLPGEQAIAERD